MADPNHTPGRVTLSRPFRDDRIEALSGSALVCMPQHEHVEHQLIWVQEGTGEYSIGGRRCLVEPQSVLVIPSGQAHGGHVTGGAEWSFLVLHLHPDAVADTLTGSLRAGLFRDRGLGDALARLRRQVDEPATLLERETALARVLAMLPQDRPESAGVKARRRNRNGVRLAIDYLHEHYADEVSLGEIARVAGSSPRQLLRSFAARTGYPPHAYQLRLRVAHACVLLSSGWPAWAAARETGFADASHFSRVFQQTLGTTPRRFTAHPTRTRGERSRVHPHADPVVDWLCTVRR